MATGAKRPFSLAFSIALGGLVVLALVWSAQATTVQTDLTGPAGSSHFGWRVTALPNGNVVVTDPDYDGQRGAVYLYSGRFHALISTLTGSQAGDQVGYSPIIVLANGNYVVGSPYWANGFNAEAGAVTWCLSTTGCSGSVSAANSLVGSQAGDRVGYGNYGLGVTALTNGNYVVASPAWANGTTPTAGAVTWGDGATGITGVVTLTNSLVGYQVGDAVGGGEVGYRPSVTALTNGNYVVRSPDWGNGPNAKAGAVTWGNGATGITGTVSPANSLVGSRANDQIGGQEHWIGRFWGSVTALTNGNYVVASPFWDNDTAIDAGAATWGDGATGITGTVSVANSLVGCRTYDRVGGTSEFNILGVTALPNGNYVVSSPLWNNGVTAQVGAATWANGAVGLTGVVTLTNSLVGSQIYDRVGLRVASVGTDNYIVASPDWDNGANREAGAVTWGDGGSGITGTVSLTNSLVGSQTNDGIGFYGVTALANGHYVVPSPLWANGANAMAGAATWANGNTGITGTVSVTNSLVGTHADDRVSGSGVAALVNGNYVVASSLWYHGSITYTGAATWANGATGLTGTISSDNSLVGTQFADQVGNEVIPLANGNYVVVSFVWANGAVLQAGAATWCNGATGCTGSVNAANSLVGTQARDQVGAGPGGWTTALPNGNYVVASLSWNNGATPEAGAVTWGDGATGITGTITTANSVLGGSANNGPLINWVYDTANDQLIVGRPAENLVTFFRLTSSVKVFLPLIKR